MALTEYDISYATKEFLAGNGYKIITWNPPGAQGTFTIPNPSKDPSYRGQTGSESPDIIAFNEQEIIFVEAKDSVTKSYSDIKKLKNMLSNPSRKELLFNICSKQMEAIGINRNLMSLKITLGISVPCCNEIRSKFIDYPDLTIFTVKSKVRNWNNQIFSANTDLSTIFEVNTFNT